jgi:hypothetical protein
MALLPLIFALLTSHAAGQDPAPSKASQSAGKPAAQSEEETRLLKTQLQAAQKCHRAALKTIAVQQLGGGLVVQVMGDTVARPDLVYTWSVRWLHAQRDLSTTKEERIAAFADHVKRMKDLHEQVVLVVGNGSGGILPASERPAADWYLAEAELWLLKEREK